MFNILKAAAGIKALDHREKLWIKRTILEYADEKLTEQRNIACDPDSSAADIALAAKRAIAIVKSTIMINELPVD